MYLKEPLCDEFENARLKGHGHAKWSACFIRENEKIFDDVPSLIDMVLYHGQPGRTKDYNGNDRDENKILNAHLISIADKLSSKERRAEEETEAENEERKEKIERSKIPLVSVFNEITLGLNTERNQKKAYSINPLLIDKETLFPTLNYPDNKLLSDAYHKICERLKSDFEMVQNDDFVTLLHLLYKHTWAIPSATPAVGIRADISLFDHARTSAAIALCLFKNYKLFENKYAESLNRALSEHFLIKISKKTGPLSKEYQKILQEPLFILLAADMFGTQDFIYAPSNIPGTSKRLRGRSFYLLMLTEIIARYITYHPEIDLSLMNILYSAGGNFQILFPNTRETISKLNDTLKEIDAELHKSFKGKIGFVFAKEEISSIDFDAWDEVLKRTEDKLNLQKKRKMRDLLREEERAILLPQDKIEGRKDICKSCGDTILYSELEEEKICDLCKKHKEIGEKLPRTEAITFHQGEGELESKNNDFETYKIDLGIFGATTLIIRKDESSTKPYLKVKGNVSNLEYYKLNDTDFVNAVKGENLQPSLGFKFLANIVPLEDDGSVMEFDNIAKKSEGAEKLGILKMDVDSLGLILQIGLSQKEPSDRTISRLATLSRMTELYFSGYIHKICEETDFKYTYIIYSGGDDLLIVGPWSKIPNLAKRIYDDFRTYTCQNEDITLSAGIFICDPKFPVKRFAYLVDDELKASKREGRNRCNFFGETVPWMDKDKKILFKELKDFGEDLFKYLNERKIARGFLHELLVIHSLCFSNSKKSRYLYLPRLIWQLHRNVKDKETREELFKKLINSLEGIKWLENIKIPVSYALLKSRRR